MTRCFFVADLHGHPGRYEKLFHAIRQQKPDAVFIGGDILPGINISEACTGDFICDYVSTRLKQLKKELKYNYPRIFVIMGNDDPKSEEQKIKSLEEEGLWEYVHFKKVSLSGYNVYGYAYIPPTPFMLKDWEKYDVSVFVDPGCVHPTEGARTVDPVEDIAFTNISKDLENLTEKEDIKNAVFLFHSPPYNTCLDRAALDGKMVDYVPLDVHVGSIAIQQFIEDKQPYLTMHGHVHESSSITEQWMQKIKKTVACSAAYHGPELALVTFVLEDLSTLKREMI